MRERGYGRIVAISSGAARSGLPGQAAYAASKAGLLGLIKTVAAENVRRGITANAILPGLVATENVLAMPAEIRERLLETLPSGRMAEPSEVAALTAYLGSEEAGYVTGEAIAIDGGGSLNTFSLTAKQRD
jgi:NAD(P)-dependent dehydrogenase (short-subunit alcohol dehydrogenase family)